MKGGSIDKDLKKRLYNSLTASNNCDWKYKESTDSKFVRKLIEDTSI